MWEAVSTLDPAAIGLAGAAGNKVAQFAKMIGELSEMRSTTEAYTLGLEIATRSGLIGTYKMQQTPESISALENIEELLNSIRVYTEEQERMAATPRPKGNPPRRRWSRSTSGCKTSRCSRTWTTRTPKSATK